MTDDSDQETKGNNLSLRFDYNFYNKITSKDLLKWIVFITSNKFDFNSIEHRLSIMDVITKVKLLGFIMEKKDFYKVIDLFFEAPEHLFNLSYFFKIEEYWKMLTEEKIISILTKMFKIKSIKSSCLVKDLRIFTGITNGQQDEENDSNENYYDRKMLYSNFVETTNQNQPKFTKMYSIHRSEVEMFLNKFSGFTPNGIVKIACIIFSFMNPQINQKYVFQDLLSMLYHSKQGFDKFTADDVLDIIDLYLNYNFSYDHVEPTIQPIFDNIQTVDELDKIFDHLFMSNNAIKMIGIFVQMHDSKKLSESRLNRLILYSIKNLQGKTKEFFMPIKNRGLLNKDFQKKFILKMASCSNVKNFEFFECIDREIFENFSRKEIDLIFQFCLRHKKYNLISNFAEYLVLNQARLIEIDDLNLISKLIINSFDNSDHDILEYLETPFFYLSFPRFAIELISFFEDDFYISTVLQSILGNPIFQKCIDYSQVNLSESIMFENEYFDRIITLIKASFPTHRNICWIFYENLNLDLKFLFKAMLIQDIIMLIKKKMKINRKESLDDKNIYIENIFSECIAYPQDLKKEKVDFFLKNFDSLLYCIAYKTSSESFKRVILDLDLEYLIEIYRKY